MSDATAAPTSGQSGILRSTLVGMIFGVDTAGHCLAMATLCFGGALAAGLGLATGIFLFGSLLSSLVLFRFSRLNVALGISQDTTISILAPAVILAASAVAGPMPAKLATAMAVIGASALLSGLAFWAIGRLGLGRLVRMFPFPVAAGFLASSGYLLVYAGFSILTHQTGFGAMAAAAGDPAVQLRLIPALIMALVMVLSIRFIGGTVPVIAVIFAALIGFYLIGFSQGMTHENMVDLGLLPQIGQADGAALSFAMVGLIDWLVVLQAAPVIVAVVFLNLLGLLLNISGVELATRADVDENRELRLAGGANILIGLVGGLTAYVQGGASVILHKLGVHQGAMILGYGIIIVLAGFLAPLMVAVVPVFIPAALLMFIGFSMLGDWLFGTFNRLTRHDWLIVLAIVLATAIVGIMPAIGIGIGLALLSFVYALIRLPVIRISTTAARRRSIRDRNTVQAETLLREGHRVRILHLQGPLFFGLVDQMTAHLRTILTAEPAVHSVIIDFTEVYHFDSSACAAIDKLSYLLQSRGIAAHLTGVSPDLQAVFGKWGLSIGGSGRTASPAAFQIWPKLDAALEHCENMLLAEAGVLSEHTDIAQVLFDLGHRHPRTAELIARLDQRHFAKGQVLITASDTLGDVFILVTGRLGVHLPTENGGSVRVRAMGPGAIVGEIAYMTGQPRNADVVCEDQVTVLCLTATTIHQIEAEDRDLAALLMSIFARSLGAKLALTNDLLTYANPAATEAAAT